MVTEADLPYDEEELISCSECLAEPATQCQVQEDLENEGWDFAGQFGPRCPECVGRNAAAGGGDGLEALAELTGAEKAPDVVAKPTKKRRKGK